MKRLEYPPGVVAGTERWQEADEAKGTPRKLVYFDYVDEYGYYHKNMTTRQLALLRDLPDEWTDIDLLVADTWGRAAGEKLETFGVAEIKVWISGARQGKWCNGRYVERACRADSFFIKRWRPNTAERDVIDAHVKQLFGALLDIVIDGDLAALLIEFTEWYKLREFRKIEYVKELHKCAYVGCNRQFERHNTRQKYCNQECATKAAEGRNRAMRIAFKAMKEMKLLPHGE